MLSGLAGVDSKGKMAQNLERYFARVRGPNIITATNAIKHSPLIDRAQPKLAERVLEYIFLSERGSYESQECFEMVIGTAIKAFYKLRKWTSQPIALYELALRHQEYSHPVPKISSKKLIARLQKDFAFE
jgi:hypothetical protein